MLQDRYLNKLKDFPEPVRKFGGLIALITIIILSFAILNIYWGGGDELPTTDTGKMPPRHVAERGVTQWQKVQSTAEDCQTDLIKELCEESIEVIHSRQHCGNHVTKRVLPAHPRG